MNEYVKNEKDPEGVPEKQAKQKSTLLQTYFTSLLCLVLCVSMFFGTTYAWFTSEVSSTGNEIYIGILDVDLRNAEGKSLENTDEKLFDASMSWEPGYTALETVHVVNKGELAFRYMLTFTDGTVSGETAKELKEAAKWFDVWCYHDAANTVPEPKDYSEITTQNGWKKIGSLADVLEEAGSAQKGKAVFYGNMNATDVANKKETCHTYTIALHMNGTTEEVDQKELNGLMGQRIGLNVKLVATQLSGEQDAFGASYDMEAFAGTLAQVNDLTDRRITYQLGTNGSTAAEVTLDTAYQFLPNDTVEAIQNAPYKYYHADFVVKADKDVPDGSIALAGYYQAWCELLADNRWVALTNDGAEIEAGTEIRLVEMLGVTVNYEEICRYGNDGIGFKCGAVELKDAQGNGKLAQDTKLTVELRLYETTENGSGTDVETGRYITVGSYEYIFD